MNSDASFRDLYDRAGDLYDLAVGATWEPTHARVGHIAHGWYQRCRRSLDCVLTLVDDGYGEESAPVMRCALEHCVALAWLADKGNALADTIRRWHAVQVDTRVAALQASDWPVADWSIFDEVTADNPGPTNQDHMWAMRHLCDAYAPPKFYAAWLIETMVSHPGYATAAAYMQSDDGERVSALVDTPPPRYDTPVAVIAWLLFATTQVDSMLTGQPMRDGVGALEAQATALLETYARADGPDL